MHRKYRSTELGRNKRATATSMHRLSLLLMLAFAFSEARLFTKNPYVAEANVNTPKGCEQLKCKIGEQCVNRKFWCNHSSCPEMTYCSKSRKESLKGPESCESVLCASGYKCVVRVRDCEWYKDCKQRTARCISEREYLDNPSSCVDVVCPTGHRCILREHHCYKPPCQLTKSCARFTDVYMWFEKCKELRCRSEHDCFLRRPHEKCIAPPCHHIPDCLPETNSEASSNAQDYCHGWICPLNQECSARFESPCKYENCQVSRTCQEPLLQMQPNVSQDFELSIDILTPKTTLDDKEVQIWLLEEQQKLHDILKPTTVFNLTKLMKPEPNFDDIIPRISPEFATVKSKRVSTLPNMRSNSSWLSYLKQKAGAEAVKYWIEKAKNNENYEEFVEWLESVARLLDRDTYQHWLREVKLASSDIPEFQSWISPQNLGSHRSGLSPLPHSRLFGLETEARSAYDDTPMVDARSFLPGSIGRQAKNHYYIHDYLDDYGNGEGRKSFDFTKPNLNPDFGRSFMEKQRAPATGGQRPLVSVSENASQQSRPNPSNFNFNEPSARFQPGIQSTDILPQLQPPARFQAPGSLPLPYLEAAQRSSDQLPASQTQEFQTVKNSWKSWQSYYQPNPPLLNLATRDPYHLINYTTVGPGENFIANRQHQQLLQPQIFYPIDQRDFGKMIAQPNSNQWYSGQKNDFQLKRSKLDDNFYEGRSDNKDDAISDGIEKMIDHVTGLRKFSDTKANVIDLDPNQPVKKFVLPSQSEVNDTMPSLLLYFPPPLNFLIYHSGKHENKTTNGQDLTKSEDDKIDNKNEKNSGLKIAYPIDKLAKQANFSDDQEMYEKSEKFDKQKELAYIRKIIRELIDYWDEEEKLLKNSRKSTNYVINTNNTDFQNSFKIGSEYKKETKTDAADTDVQNIDTNDPENAKLTFEAFLEWLIRKPQNDSSLLSVKSRKRRPPNYKETRDNTRSNENFIGEKSSHTYRVKPRLYLGSLNKTNATSSKKIRILVDIDKNPEMMKVLLSKNRTVSKNEFDPNEYQVIVNMNDFVDPKEHDLISRKLTNIVTNQLHRNLSEDQKLPKTLWVFPIFEDEENDTLIDVIERSNNKRINSLEDVNIPMMRSYKKIVSRNHNNNTNIFNAAMMHNEATSTKDNVNPTQEDDENENESSETEDSNNDTEDYYEE